MIRLEVEDYCHECCDFDPDVVRPCTMYSVFEPPITIADTVIRCEHRSACKYVKEYTEARMKGENKNV